MKYLLVSYLLSYNLLAPRPIMESGGMQPDQSWQALTQTDLLLASCLPAYTNLNVLTVGKFVVHIYCLLFTVFSAEKARSSALLLLSLFIDL